MGATSVAEVFKHHDQTYFRDRTVPARSNAATAVRDITDATMKSLLERTEAAMCRVVLPLAARTTPLKSSAAAAAGYHLACGGRRLRAQLALSACLSTSVVVEDAIAIAAAAELLHNASLVHDDLQDRDEKRRGAPAVWAHFGDAVALCTGDLLLSSAYAAIASFSRPELLGSLVLAMHRATREAIEGQCEDVAVKSLTKPEQYREIVVAKSGAMLFLPMHLALIASGAQQFGAQVREACDAFALGYQIADDLADLVADSKGPTGSQAMNAVLVLKADGRGETALQDARKWASESLNDAITKTHGLPNHCAWLLRDLAAQLVTEL